MKIDALILILLLLFLTFHAALLNAAGDGTSSESLRDVRRIVFLGDSITQKGDYIVDIECWLLSQGFRGEIINLGLASETATDLTPQENEPHLKAAKFGRPFVSERLDRVLAATQPDWLFVCYGMNDGGSLPASEEGTKRFVEATTRLRDAAIKSGVKRVVFSTPPVHDSKNSRKGTHEENLERYTQWLLSKRADGWDVVDIHTPMRKALDEGRAKDPAFLFAKDGTHPNPEGHWLMAVEILKQIFGANLDGIDCSEKIFPANGGKICKLVNDRMTLRFTQWMTRIGHQRPGVAGAPGSVPALPDAEFNEKVETLTTQIEQALNAK